LSRPQTRKLARVAEQELQRAMRVMRIPRHPRPYFISYLIRDREDWRLQAKYGSLVSDLHDRSRNAFADVRVGSYRSDHLRHGGLEDNDKEAESYGYTNLPYGSGTDGLRHGLWMLTDARYREAVESLLSKRSHEVTYLDRNRHLRAFERRAPIVDFADSDLPEVDVDHWRDYVEQTSRVTKRFSAIKDSHVEFQVDYTTRVFVDSEGTRVADSTAIWSLECYLWLLSARGDSFPWTLKYIVTDPAELPDTRRFQREIRETIGNLERLAQAKPLRAFSGPALLEPIPAGLLVHEALGHRLEGNRLLSSGEGQTFKDSLGESVLPEFLSIYDDPTLERFEGRSLVGHYRYDDEGVPARRAELVTRGKLTGFLTTRTGSVPRQRSNGHARSAHHERPISRMGTLVVEAANGSGDNELRGTFLEEIRRQGVPFGVRIVDALSGETATDAYNFQAFLGEVHLAAKVFPDGREEWIRGVNFVGTPLNAVRGIVAAGTRYRVDNAFCGAESGYVPVSTISPALVISELELQAKPDSPYTQYTYPLPWRR
jgi:predicted Zn-dependent protease